MKQFLPLFIASFIVSAIYLLCYSVFNVNVDIISKAGLVSLFLLVVGCGLLFFIGKQKVTNERSLIFHVFGSILYTILFFTFFIVYYITEKPIANALVYLLLTNYFLYKAAFVYSLTKIK